MAACFCMSGMFFFSLSLFLSEVTGGFLVGWSEYEPVLGPVRKKQKKKCHEGVWGEEAHVICTF